MPVHLTRASHALALLGAGLPLAAKAAPGESLVPPADVAWLWHCHRLAPYRYAQHCRQDFSKVVEAHPPFAFQHAEPAYDQLPPGAEAIDAGAKARDLWANAYPGEPFFLPSDNSPGASEPSSPTGVLADFDVLGSAERQATFLWQVSQPKFEDEEFLADGVEAYRRFVMLRKHAPEQTIVPTYQIDLMWHTHILADFGNYHADCLALSGKTLNHVREPLRPTVAHLPKV